MDERNETEQTFLNDPALIQGIADAAPGMLYVIDVRYMKIVYANQKVLSLFGKTLKELGQMGARLFDEYVYPEDRPRFDQHITDLLKTSAGEVKELTFRLLNAQRKPTWVRTRRSVYKRDHLGAPTHVISISQDISREIELQQIRAQLEAEKILLKEERQLEIFKATLATQEEERRRISESLHNGLGQLLYGVKLNVSMLNLENPETFLKTKKYAQDLLEEGIKETRRISHQLMPTVLHDFGIRAALEDVCKKMEGQINFSIDFQGSALLTPKYIELAIFRIIQELILNVGKHAHADLCKIFLSIQNRAITIQVSDNGRGFNQNAAYTSGIGLKSIRNKVSLLKGQLAIKSGNTGTETTISIPKY